MSLVWQLAFWACIKLKQLRSEMTSSLPWEPLPPYQRTVLGTAHRVCNPRPEHGLWSHIVLIRDRVSSPGIFLSHKHLNVKSSRNHLTYQAKQSLIEKVREGKGSFNTPKLKQQQPKKTFQVYNFFVMSVFSNQIFIALLKCLRVTFLVLQQCC